MPVLANTSKKQNTVLTRYKALCVCLESAMLYTTHHVSFRPERRLFQIYHMELIAPIWQLYKCMFQSLSDLDAGSRYSCVQNNSSVFKNVSKAQNPYSSFLMGPFSLIHDLIS